jgi:hypothetical protein
MIWSQSSAQQTASCSSGIDTGTKRIVTSKGFAVDLDPPRSQPAAKLLLLKEYPTEREYSLLLAALLVRLRILAGYPTVLIK